MRDPLKKALKQTFVEVRCFGTVSLLVAEQRRLLLSDVTRFLYSKLQVLLDMEKKVIGRRGEQNNDVSNAFSKPKH